MVKWEMVLTRKVCSTSAAVEARIDFVWTMPALLIRIVGGPSCVC